MKVTKYIKKLLSIIQKIVYDNNYKMLNILGIEVPERM